MRSTFQLSETGGEGAIIFGEYNDGYIVAGEYNTRVC